ncbi:YveK family protein [Pedococcus sp. 2YAF34]|uniref:YveK family protein n=1 Tax=Pedococcus sp. 2YAF34 TaxID=3233032 RepID=UPI003F986AAD
MTTSIPRELEGTPGFARGFLRAHLKLILAFAALVTLGAGMASYAQPDAYTAVARVVVEPKLLPSGGVPPLPDMGTEKALALSGTVTGPAAQALGLTEDQALQGISVSVPVDTHVLEFKATTTTPGDAARRAKVFSEAYVEVRSKAPDATVPRSVEVITPATVPTSPSGPNHQLHLAVALVLGLALGTALAAAWDRWDHHVRAPGELVELTLSPVLAVVPRPRLRGSARLVVADHPHSSVAEDYRFLATHLLGLGRPDGPRTLVVTCAGDIDLEARDVVAANLAAAAAEAGHSVVVVPEEQDVEEAQELLGWVQLPVEVSSEGTGAAAVGYHRLMKTHDLVIVQAAAVTKSASTLEVVQRCDVAVLVVDTELSDRRTVREAHRLAKNFSKGPVCSVLTHRSSLRSAGLPSWARRVRGGSPLDSHAVAGTPTANGDLV